jgi:lysyl-tRNA synthetase, class II
MERRSEQETIRIQKLAELREQGFRFPNDVRVTGTSADIERQEVSEAPESGPRHRLAGRIVQSRKMGKASFCHIQDATGRVQLYIRQDSVGVEAYEGFRHFDIGDIIEASGYVFLTKTGEKTLHAESVRLLVKSLIPLPEKWHGLVDPETRYRQRYIDLITNPQIRDTFKKRSQIIRGIRSFFDMRNFIEVETPVLHYVAEGAEARPFATHHNALSADMFLRIALEIPLKKLVVGGLERVYEIGRVFRNEGISKKHNPEFTMLEFYQAYATFEDLMELTESLFRHLAIDVVGSLTITYQGEDLDFGTPWRRLSMTDSLYEVGGLSRDVDVDDLSVLQRVAQHDQIELEDASDWGRVVEALWSALVEPKLRNPTFITHHPLTISPLSRVSEHDPRITDRFELIVAGMELANGFSELNDVDDQRKRFIRQIEKKRQQDPQDQSQIEEDFLRALEYGLPPTAGQGIGIDRLVMLLTDAPTIREILLFPQLRPEREVSNQGEE